MQDEMEKYKKLIEYLKLDYFRGTIYFSENTKEYGQLRSAFKADKCTTIRN